MGKINIKFFISTKGNDLLIVQIHVNNIIFSASNISLRQGFYKCIQNEFEMSI